MKRILLGALIFVSVVVCSCSNTKNVEVAESTIESSESVLESSESVAESTKAKIDVVESVNKMNEVNPDFNPLVDFTYIGEDKILKAVTDEMVKDAKIHFLPEGVVEIPSPYIIKTDDSDKEDIKVYGDFLIDGYRMDGTVFYTENGGSFPGCYHLAEDSNGNVTFVSKEIAEDGGNFDESLRNICGGDTDLYEKIINKDNYVVEAMRVLYASMYANANGLRLSGIKDYGWPIILLNSISDSQFLYNFYLSYFEEMLDENLLNDLDARKQNLVNKYMIETLREKIKSKTEESGFDFVTATNDVTDEMVGTLQVDDYGNGNLKVRYASSTAKLTEINVKVENHNGALVITDINY